jgi:hypothetical protein
MQVSFALFGFSLIISAVILLILSPHGQTERDVKHFALMGDTTEWAFFYLFLALMALRGADLYYEKRQEKKL